jgi:hypothetical protein
MGMSIAHMKSGSGTTNGSIIITTRQPDRANGGKIKAQSMAKKILPTCSGIGFDFVAATSRERGGSHKMIPHIQRFPSLATLQEISEATITSFVASALLMDCYLVCMHCTRDMRLVGLLLTACNVISRALARRVAGMERAGRGGSAGAEEGARIAGRAGHGGRRRRR